MLQRKNAYRIHERKIYRICILKENYYERKGCYVDKRSDSRPGRAAAYLWEYGTLINALIALVALDYVTGVICAAANKRLSSEIGFKGLIKRRLYLRW